MNPHAYQIKQIQTQMIENNIDFYIIFTADPHLSEYIAPYFKTREFLSGFTGSAGTLVLTKTQAFLWTDGRYYLQAEKELQGSGIILEKQNHQHTLLSYLEKHCDKNHTIATDFSVLSFHFAKELEKKCKLIHKDFVSQIWDHRPKLPKNKVYEHKEIYNALNRKEKIANIFQKITQLNAKNHLISSLDDIAWICNLRGSDIEFNPVFLAHLLFCEDKVFLFVDQDKIDSKLKNKLYNDGINIQSYNQLEKKLKELKNTTILLDPLKTTTLFVKQLCHTVKIIEETNPSTFLKSCKHEKEIKHIKNAMIEDGVALCKFFSFLEEAMKKNQNIDEVDIDELITCFRKQSPYYISNSFETIAGFNQNGAFVHYKANKENCAFIQGNGLLLIDSGAQYLNGTTDITRVVPIGKITKEQKKDYTLVLKAHINLACASFPENINMSMLDSIARVQLWKENLDYAHGTGHGVGYFLNVHEGPQNISFSSQYNTKNKAKEGMLTSIEPGIYKTGKWGIRLENLVINRKKNKINSYGNFLHFETLTLCPFEPSCIDLKLLNTEEKRWLKNYNQKVYNKLHKKLDSKALQWLKKRTVDFIL